MGKIPPNFGAIQSLGILWSKLRVGRACCFLTWENFGANFDRICVPQTSPKLMAKLRGGGARAVFSPGTTLGRTSTEVLSHKLRPNFGPKFGWGTRARICPLVQLWGKLRTNVGDQELCPFRRSQTLGQTSVWSNFVANFPQTSPKRKLGPV